MCVSAGSAAVPSAQWHTCAYTLLTRIHSLQLCFHNEHTRVEPHARAQACGGGREAGGGGAYWMGRALGRSPAEAKRRTVHFGGRQ